MTRFAAPLTRRQLEILLAVVREHVRTREPVGSQVVRDVHGVRASTATIRNEMMELEQAGYLHQPHTSAGRLPCDSAYRLYVNHLSQHETPELPADGWIRGEYRRMGSEPHELMRKTSRLLARLTAHPAVVTLPSPEEPTITAIHVQPVSGNTVLFSYSTSSAAEHHHLLRTENPVTAAQLTELTALLEQQLIGSKLTVLAQLPLSTLRAAMCDTPLPEELLTSISGAAASDDRTEVYVEGTSYILDEPEFEERERLRAFMQTLDEESALRRILQVTVDNPEMTVTIGAEHQVPAMRNCSLVATSYPYGRTRGAVGIFGPTRMDYRRAMGAVRFVAQRLSETLAEIDK